MNGEPLELLIRVALMATCFITAYLSFERLLGVGFRRSTDELLLNELTAAWRRDRKITPHHDRDRLGWLWKPLNEAQADLTALWRACAQEKRDVERFGGCLHFVASIAMVIGLLGMLNQLQINSAGGMDASQVVGNGVGPTMFGIGIAIVASVGEFLLRQRTPGLLFQTEVVLEALEEALVVPPEPELAPPSPVDHVPAKANAKDNSTSAEIGLAPTPPDRKSTIDPKTGVHDRVLARNPSPKNSAARTAELNHQAIEWLSEEDVLKPSYEPTDDELAPLRKREEPPRNNGNGLATGLPNGAMNRPPRGGRS